MKTRLLCLLTLFIFLFCPAAQADNAFGQDPDAIEAAASSVLMLDVYDQSGDIIATGSGFILFDNRTLVTNYHVIDGSAKITAESDDGFEYDISGLLICNSEKDLAILQLKTPTVMAPLPYSTASVRRGQPVTAIGSPRGLKNTVSTGIISSYYTMDGVDYLQFTAPISPGSSGGALFNDAGEVIGVTSAHYIDAQNLNLAITMGEVTDLYAAWDGKTSVPLTQCNQVDLASRSAAQPSVPAASNASIDNLGYSISLWLQNNEQYLSDASYYGSLSSLADDEYYAPRLILTNQSSQAKSLRMYWLVDGETVEWDPFTIDAFAEKSSTYSRETADSLGSGSHTAQIYVNDTYLTDFSWVISGARATEAPSIPFSQKDVSISLWTQDNDSYYNDVGNSASLSDLSSGQYIAPRMYLTNSTSSDQNVDLEWLVDDESITWDPYVLAAGDTKSWTLSQSTAESYGVGTHTARIFVNGVELTSYTWTISASGNTVNPSANTVSSSGSVFSASNVRLSVWLQDENNYIKEMNTPASLAALSDGQYYAPRMYLTNPTGVDQTVNIRWVVDGKDEVTWSSFTLPANAMESKTFSMDTAVGLGSGFHTAQIYINDAFITAYTWNIKP